MRIDSVSAVVINKQIGGHNNDIIWLKRRKMVDMHGEL